MGCTFLKRVEFPGSLEEICLRAFRETGLESVTIPSSVRVLRQSAFCNCQDLRTAVLEEGLEVLGTDEYTRDGGRWFGVFEGSGLENVQLPSTLRRIEYDVFEDCPRLQSIDLPAGLEFIGKACFAGSALRSFAAPAALRTLSQGAVAKCEALRTVELNEGLETLGTDEYLADNEMWNGVF